jgi:peroxiredoxin Q/BCP
MPTVGETVPDFELPNQDGKMVKLSSFRGKKVILFAYPAAFTGGCTKQACGFRDQFPKIEAGNAIVLGLSPDDVQKLNDWKKAENLPYDLLSDPDHKVMEAWGAWGEKTNYGKTSFGVIRSHWVIDENGVLVSQKLNVKPEDSVEKAVASLGG